VENPFCLTGALFCTPGAAGPSAPLARMSLAPDNQANTIAGTVGADLPFKSRYMATVSYEMMRQNQAFLPFTINPNTGALINGQNAASLGALPVTSLNGAVNTLLVNNVLTTQITSDLKSKASYRYYNYNNDTPEIRFSNWILNDSLPAAISPSLAPVSSLSVAYTRQNAGEELTWRPARQWNIGAAYGYERYDWTRADASATNENSGKAFVATGNQRCGSPRAQAGSTDSADMKITITSTSSPPPSGPPWEHPRAIRPRCGSSIWTIANATKGSSHWRSIWSGASP
jgi:hypothetical protein